VIANVLVERHLICAMPPSPPALPVSNLIDDDAEDPGAKGRLPAKTVQRSKDAKEDLLREIQRFLAVAEQVRRQPQHKPVMLVDQFRMGDLVTREAPFDEERLALWNVLTSRQDSAGLLVKLPATWDILPTIRRLLTGWTPSSRKFHAPTPAQSLTPSPHLALSCCREEGHRASPGAWGGLAATGILAARAVEQDREYRRLIVTATTPLARGEAFVAIESYSGAIALKGDSMLAYLKRGEAHPPPRRLARNTDGRPPGSQNGCCARPEQYQNPGGIGATSITRCTGLPTPPKAIERYLQLDDRSAQSTTSWQWPGAAPAVRCKPSVPFSERLR
jgi:hypothetical protein